MIHSDSASLKYNTIFVIGGLLNLLYKSFFPNLPEKLQWNIVKVGLKSQTLPSQREKNTKESKIKSEKEVAI